MQAEPRSRPTFSEVVERLRLMCGGQRPAHDVLAGRSSSHTNESDELEIALREQLKKPMRCVCVRGGGGR